MRRKKIVCNIVQHSYILSRNIPLINEFILIIINKEEDNYIWAAFICSTCWTKRRYWGSFRNQTAVCKKSARIRLRAQNTTDSSIKNGLHNMLTYLSIPCTSLGNTITLLSTPFSFNARAYCKKNESKQLYICTIMWI